MADDKLQKKLPDSLKEKTQYFLAFGVIATMLMVAGFPTFVIFFFGIFAYFLWKTFSSPSHSETREIFEFYLSANELLRDDERRWFGFEMQEVVGRGERILQYMHTAPPLVHFTLGALYNKTGDYKSAVNHLAYIVENENSDEKNYSYPSPELRNYVRVLRKIEREPAEAPQTSAAIRALERARRNRGKTILEESREKLAEQTLLKQAKKFDLAELRPEPIGELPAEENYSASLNGNSHENYPNVPKSITDDTPETIASKNNRMIDPLKTQQISGAKKRVRKVRHNQDEDKYGNRKPISEVLHEIYDKNIQ